MKNSNSMIFSTVIVLTKLLTGEVFQGNSKECREDDSQIMGI